MMEKTRSEWLKAIVILHVTMVTLGLQTNTRAINFLDQVSHCYTLFNYEITKIVFFLSIGKLFCNSYTSKNKDNVSMIMHDSLW